MCKMEKMRIPFEYAQLFRKLGSSLYPEKSRFLREVDSYATQARMFYAYDVPTWIEFTTLSRESCLYFCAVNTVRR